MDAVVATICKAWCCSSLAAITTGVKYHMPNCNNEVQACRGGTNTSHLLVLQASPNKATRDLHLMCFVPSWSVQVSVVLYILLIAHGSFPIIWGDSFSWSCLWIILPRLVLCTLWPVYMFNALRYLVSLAQVLLQVIGFSRKQTGAYLQRRHDEVGDWLACLSIVVNCTLKPN